MSEAHDHWDARTAALSLNILGESDRTGAIGSLQAWLVTHGLDDPEIGSLSLSVGATARVRLRDGRSMFLKVWPPEADKPALAAQLEVQASLVEQGFPAPMTLSGLSRFGDGCAVLMEFNRNGSPTDVRIPGVLEIMAQGLARLVKVGRDLVLPSDLPEHQLPTSLWPNPHNVLFDFDATAAGADWIDEVAHNALAVLRSQPLQPVLGHLDWSAKNMRVGEKSLAVVYDWDAAHLASEAFIVGAAAACFPTTWELPVAPVPTRDQIAAFIEAYEFERGSPFDAHQRSAVAASIDYYQAYTARCDHALDPSVAMHRWGHVLARRAL